MVQSLHEQDQSLLHAPGPHAVHGHQPVQDCATWLSPQARTTRSRSIESMNDTGLPLSPLRPDSAYGPASSVQRKELAEADRYRSSKAAGGEVWAQPRFRRGNRLFRAGVPGPAARGHRPPQTEISRELLGVCRQRPFRLYSASPIEGPPSSRHRSNPNPVALAKRIGF